MLEKPSKSIESTQARFGDGRLFEFVSVPGARFEFDPRGLTDPKDRTTTILVQTKLGKIIAIGEGVAVVLPSYNSATGKFERQPGEELAGTTFDHEDPTGDRIIIGEPWSSGFPDDEVTQVMWDDKSILSPSDGRSGSITGPNPFDSAHEQLTLFRQSLEQTGRQVDYR